MQEQTSRTLLSTQQAQHNLPEELLLSPQQKTQLYDQGPTLNSVTGSLAQEQLPGSINIIQESKVEDSLLLSRNDQKDESGLVLSLNPLQASVGSHEEAICLQHQTLVPQEKHFKQQNLLQKEDVIIKASLSKRNFTAFESSQNQTIFQSNHNISYNHINTNTQQQSKINFQIPLPSPSNPQNTECKEKISQTINPISASLPAKNLQIRQGSGSLQSNKVNSSQQLLLGILCAFRDKLQPNLKQQCHLHQQINTSDQVQTLQKDDLFYSKDDDFKDHCETSMIVNYSEQKQRREYIKQTTCEEATYLHINTQPMQIQQVSLKPPQQKSPQKVLEDDKQKQKSWAPMDIEIHGGFSTEVIVLPKITTNSHSNDTKNLIVQEENFQKDKPYHETPIQSMNHYHQQRPENLQPHLINNSLSENQVITENLADFNDSRNLSIQVNINQDSMPQFLEKSMQNVNTESVPIGIDQSYNCQKPQFQRKQQCPPVSLHLSSSLQQLSTLKLNDNDQHNRYPSHSKDSSQQSSELIQYPHIQIKSQGIQQQTNHTNIKTDHINADEGIMEVIELDQLHFPQPQNQLTNPQVNENNNKNCKLLNQSSNLRDPTQESVTVGNKYISLSPWHEDRAGYSEDLSKETHRSLYQTITGPNLGQSSFHQDRAEQKQANQTSHSSAHNDRRQIQGQELDLQQIKEESIIKKAPLPVVPPCITININRNHQISLNIYNNHPFIQQPAMIQPLPIFKENKSVQNDQSLITNNQTLIDENIPISTTARKLECKRERKFIRNASIDLEKEPEIVETNNNEANLQSINKQPVNICQPFIQKTSDTVAVASPETIEQKYLQICQQAQHYLLNSNPDESTHKSFQQLLKPHITARLSTEPISQVGDLLFKNGLILVSIVKLFVRQTKTPFLANYIFQHFSSAFSVQHSRFLFEQKAKKAREDYINYLDKQYQEGYLKNRENNQQKDEENHRETTIKRIQIKPLTELQNCYTPGIQKIKKLMLNSNFYSLSERPLPETFKQHKNKHFQPSHTHSNSKQQKERTLPHNVIYQSKEKSSQSSIEYDKQDPSKRSVEKCYSSMNKNPQKTVNSVSKTINNVAKEDQRVEERQNQTIMKSRVVENKHQPTQSNFIEHQNLVSTAQMPGARFDELYKRYKRIRESIRISGSAKAEEPSGILKPSSSQSKEKSGAECDPKKKKNVQFLDDAVESKEHSNGQEAPIKKNKKKKTKPKVESSLEEGTEEATTRNRNSKR